MFETETKPVDDWESAMPVPRHERVSLCGLAAKFSAGFIAGTCAVLLPHVLAVRTHGGETHLVFPPAPYLLLALGAGLFIGVVILVITARWP